MMQFSLRLTKDGFHEAQQHDNASVGFDFSTIVKSS